MLPQLLAVSLNSSVCFLLGVIRRFGSVIRSRFLVRSGGGMMFREPLGAIRTFEFMAFTGNAHQEGNGHKKDGE